MFKKSFFKTIKNLFINETNNCISNIIDTNIINTKTDKTKTENSNANEMLTTNNTSTTNCDMLKAILTTVATTTTKTNIIFLNQKNLCCRTEILAINSTKIFF